MKLEGLQDMEGNEVIILKGPFAFNNEIKKEMEADWDKYLGLDIDDPEQTEGDWYYVRVSRVVNGPEKLGEECWCTEYQLCEY
jgi:hypothetical protein